MLALVHAPSPKLAAGQRTHVAREAIDIDRMQKQHAAYCQALADCGGASKGGRESIAATMSHHGKCSPQLTPDPVVVRVIDVNGDAPDGVFIEDTAIVLDELAILCSMGTAARRREPLAIEPVLREFREVRRIEWPALIEGGDVLCIGRELLVGLSSRTSTAGVEALANLVRPLGYSVTTVPVRGCLHLKTACTALPDGRLLISPAWLDISALRGACSSKFPPPNPGLPTHCRSVSEFSCPLPTSKRRHSWAASALSRCPWISPSLPGPRGA